MTELPIIGGDYLPETLDNSVIAIAIVILGLSFLGYGAASSESKLAIETYIGF